MEKDKYSIIVPVITFLILSLLTQDYVASGNVGSRFATIESLVERNTFAIDDSTFFGDAKSYRIEGEMPLMRLDSQSGINGTNDMILVDGRFYSDKPPVLSFMAAGIYYPLYLLGIRFMTNGPLAVYLLTLLTIGLPVSALAFFLYRFCRKSCLTEKDSLFCVSALLFGTLVFPYSVTFNNHILCAILAFISFYLIFFSSRYDFLAGFLSSLAFTFDLVAGGVLLAAFAGYMLFKKRNITRFAAGCVVPVALHIILSLQVTGDILPGSAHPEYWNYPGSDFSEATLTGFAKHSSLADSLGYAAHMLIGYRGLLSYSPILILSLIAIGLMVMKRYDRFLPEAIMILLSASAICGYYIMFSDNYGGWSYGVRWFVSFIPLLFIPTIYLFTDLKSRLATILFYILLLVSFVFSAIGVYQPWTDMWFSPVPLVNNLRNIVKAIR